MQREQTTVRRIEVTRRPVLVRCAFGQPQDRIRNRYQSCGALIPYKPKGICPECGQRQLNPHAAAPPPDARIIDGSAALVDSATGEVVAAQVVAATNLAYRIAAELRAITDWNAAITVRGGPANEGRLSGIIVTHRTFGFVPPQPLRRRYACTGSRLDFDYPSISRAIGEFCTVAEHVFRTQATDVYEETANNVRDLIAPAWLIEGTPWTSGIINHTAALPYHRDRNNIPGSWSAMLACRRAVDGGLLHLVDYDVWLTIPHGSITIFDGQSVVHGVSPLRLVDTNPFRYTLVTYARSGLKVCCPDPVDEPRRASLVATNATTRRRG
jgi:hypothetical protein